MSGNPAECRSRWSVPSEKALHYSNIHFYRKSLRYSCHQWLEAIARPVISRQSIFISYILTFVGYPVYLSPFLHEDVP